MKGKEIMSTIFDNDTKQIVPLTGRPTRSMILNPFSIMSPFWDAFLAPAAESYPKYQDYLPKKTTNEDGSMSVEFTVAGYQVDEIKAEVDTKSRRLTIHAEHEESGSKKEYSTSISLHPNVDIENMSSELKNGILTVKIPMKPEEENSVVSLVIEKKE